MRVPRGLLLHTRIMCYALFHVVISVAVQLKKNKPGTYQEYTLRHTHCQLGSYMDQPTLSPSKVEKAREVIDLYHHCPYHKPLVRHQAIRHLREVAHMDLVIKMVSWEVTLDVGWNNRLHFTLNT